MESSNCNAATSESTQNNSDSSAADTGCGCSSITISVTPTTGGQFDLAVTKNDTIENIKKIISKRLKVSKERICLLYRERQLRNGTVQENQLVEGSRLTLLPSVETGLLTQRPEQSVMQALESLNDSQVNDFLSGKAPLNLTMRLGDHMMLIQLQLSTVMPNSSSGTKRSLSKCSSSPPAKSIKLHHNKSTQLLSIVNDKSSTQLAARSSLESSCAPASTSTEKDLMDHTGLHPSSTTPSCSDKSLLDSNTSDPNPSNRSQDSSNSVSSVSDSCSVRDVSNLSSRSISSILAEALTDSLSSSLLQPCTSFPSDLLSLSPSTTSNSVSTAAAVSSTTSSDVASSTVSSSVFSSSNGPGSPHSPRSPHSPNSPNSPQSPESPASPSSTSIPSTPASPGSSSSSSAASSPTSTTSSSSCKCYPTSSSSASPRPMLDTRALVEASRNLTQTLKQLSSEVLTSKPDSPEEVASSRRRQGAIIESMHHHGKGVYSGTFSGTLNPALQDRFGRPKRDISTIIHILNDLLCATPQYRASRPNATASSAAGTTAGTTASPTTGTSATFAETSTSSSASSDASTATASEPPDAETESVAESLENQATRGKMERLRMIMEERRERRKARRSAPYNKNNSLNSLDSDQQQTHWSAKSETQSVLPNSDSALPMEGEAPVCSELSPEPVVA